ncbi:MAG: DinB family protein [Pseudonocardia sp.]|nr:DinB family protein [Pseudonocardia sp.]
MNSIDVLADAFARVHGSAHAAAADLTPEQLTWRADPDANTIAWLLWHLARVQDDHVAGVADVQQVWTAQGWAARFALPFDVDDIGYGHSGAEVAAVDVDSAKLLTDYVDAVHEQTLRLLRTLTDADLDRVVDAEWDPPVTLGVRLVSVINDDLQHVGQAAFLRGLIGRQG